MHTQFVLNTCRDDHQYCNSYTLIAVVMIVNKHTNVLFKFHYSIQEVADDLLVTKSKSIKIFPNRFRVYINILLFIYVIIAWFYLNWERDVAQR